MQTELASTQPPRGRVPSTLTSSSSSTSNLAQYKRANQNVARPKSGKLFAGDRGFDPVTIILQMAAMQFCYYATLTICIIFCDLVAGLRPHTAQLFSATAWDWTAERYGKSTIVAHTLNIGFVVLAEAHIVEKAIKCLDFTLTIVFFHLIIMSCTYGFPSFSAHLFDWWLLNAAIVTGQCVFSEMLCMKLETAEIKLTVDDLIESGKRGAANILTAVQTTGEQVVEST